MRVHLKLFWHKYLDRQKRSSQMLWSLLSGAFSSIYIRLPHPSTTRWFLDESYFLVPIETGGGSGSLRGYANETDDFNVVNFQCLNHNLKESNYDVECPNDGGFLSFLQMLNLKHDNVNEFVGVCCEAPNVCVLMEYASKGSLQDLIFNDSVTFSDDLRISFVFDIVKVRWMPHWSCFVVYLCLKM